MKITILENIGQSSRDTPLNLRQFQNQLANSITKNIVNLLNNICGITPIDRNYGMLEPYIYIDEKTLNFIIGQVKQYEKRLLSFKLSFQEGEQENSLLLHAVSNCNDIEFIFDAEFVVQKRAGLTYFFIKKNSYG
jgi:hypothetical protein